MKSQNIHVQRIGDWVCMKCTNLNFSFREVCNRCQTQTKKSNTIQVNPLFQNFHANIFQQHVSPFQNEQTFQGSRVFRENQTQSKVCQKSQVGRVETTFTSNPGFTNMLLITPPKGHRPDPELFSGEQSQFEDDDISQIYKQLIDEEPKDLQRSKINFEKICQIDQRIPKNAEYDFFQKRITVDQHIY